MDENQPQEDKPRVKRQRRKRNRYSKIPLKTKLLFYRKVIHEKGNLRDVAKRLGLKYSTAKTLIRNYKQIPEQQNHQLMLNICQVFDLKQRTKKRCSYREVTPANEQQQRQGHQENLQFTFMPKIQIICNYIQSYP